MKRLEKHLKITLIYISLGLIMMMPQTVHAQSASISVVVNNITEVKGKIEICLFNSAETFMGKCLQRKYIAVTRNSMEITFDDILPGTYAVTIYQDINENEELDTNFIGMPKEPYGFSNNPSTTFGPPSFKKASFKVFKNKEITISL